MATLVVPGIDVIAANLGSLPSGPLSVVAGYDTQVGANAGIKWSPQQYADIAARSRYAPIHMAQLPAGDPETADLLDMESGAAGVGTLQSWAPAAIKSYQDVVRPGQRNPVAYVEGSEVTPAVNGLIAVGIHSFPLVLTAPMSEANAIAILENTSGPFPFVGVQYGFPGSFDLDVYSLNWLTTVSEQKLSFVDVTTDVSLRAPLLVLGDNSAWVKAAQGTLNVHGGTERLACDGDFGPDMLNRVLQFQTVQFGPGPQVDGKIGPLTWGRLVPAKMSVPVLSQGYSGNWCEMAQGFLDTNGYSLTCDGVFGPETLTTVKLFQAHMDLPETGVLDSLNWTDLLS